VETQGPLWTGSAPRFTSHWAKRNVECMVGLAVQAGAYLPSETWLDLVQNGNFNEDAGQDD
jgi:hypothetical protein